MADKIKKILIANRGEIAVRVMRACRDLGIRSVAIYSDCDSSAYHVRMADEAHYIGASPAIESYLNQDAVMSAVKKSGADAVHPGYGFLAENAVFAERCERDGICFIGPRPETIRLLGDKLAARRAAVEAGIPVLGGAELEGDDTSVALARAKEIGYPVLVKAAAGGGGKGMRVVQNENSLAQSLASASREAQSAFGDGRVFLETFLPNPRHIEIQILCDTHGHAIHLGERECSIQRRHQKVIEESPSPVMTPELRKRMGEAAVSIARASNYVGVGTVEFLVDDDLSFYFLEVNTRLQVEHAVTEMVTGIDLVKEQIAVAEGNRLSFTQEDVHLRGHAIECRIYAEDPDNGFIPSTGKLKNYRPPGGPGVRVDSGVVIFSDVPVYYDPMIAKLIVWGETRGEAISRACRALQEYRISGVQTTVGFHLAVLRNEAFARGDISTRFLEDEFPDGSYHTLTEDLARQAAIAVAMDLHARRQKISIANINRNSSRVSHWRSFHRERSLRTFRREN